MKPKHTGAVPIQPTLLRFVVDEPLARPNVGIIENALVSREFVAWAELPKLAVDSVGLHFDGRE